MPVTAPMEKKIERTAQRRKEKKKKEEQNQYFHLKASR